MRFFKRIAYDIAGVTLILLGAAFGWLPGPGGIPLVLTGLYLLSVHNKWAHGLLEWAKINAENFLDIIFPTNNKFLIWFHDIVALALLLFALFLFNNLDKPYSYLYPAAFTIVGLFWFMYNARRYNKVSAFFKRLF